MPTVPIDYFESFTGITLTDDEVTRVTVMLDRARRNFDDQVNVPDPLEGDDLLTYEDAVAELAWLYWEAEKASVMEILALPLTQLSLGTLFWTKSSNATASSLTAVGAAIAKWGVAKRARIVLEGELAYPD